MSQNESTQFLVTDAKNLTLIDATRENSPWCLEDMSSFRLAFSRVTLLYEINQARISTLDFKLPILGIKYVTSSIPRHEKVASMQALLAGNF